MMQTIIIEIGPSFKTILNGFSFIAGLAVLAYWIKGN